MSYFVGRDEAKGRKFEENSLEKARFGTHAKDKPYSVML